MPEQPPAKPERIQKQLSCFDPIEGLMSVEQALGELAAVLSPVQETEVVPLASALGRYVAQPVRSPIAVPGHTNSAMDGYALDHRSIPREGLGALTVLGTAWAGRGFAGSVGIGEAVQVMTGAPMPAGCDTVVINEHVERDQAAQALWIDSAVKPFANVRQAGEDIQAGEQVLEAGQKLAPAEIALLASLGLSQCTVYRPLRVAYFSTGDELCALDSGIAPKDLAHGQVFDSNRYALQAMLERSGVTWRDFGLVKDQLTDTLASFERALAWADVVISSGGASAGEADFVSQSLQQLGQAGFWRLAMRPGRPLAYGLIERDGVKRHCFGLPGNPVAVMVTFYQFVLPAIERLAGGQWQQPLLFEASAASDIRKSRGRVEFQRGIVFRNAEGELQVRTTGKQGAGRLSSMVSANCFIVLEADRATVKAGERVRVQPFDGLV